MFRVIYKQDHQADKTPKKDYCLIGIFYFTSLVCLFEVSTLQIADDKEKTSKEW
jgi:hypothetical protein